MRTKWNRREFIKSSAFVAAVSLAAPAGFSLQRTAKARGLGEVVLARDPAATSGLTNVNEAIVQKIVDNGIRQFSGLDNIGDAWRSIFPRLDKEAKIGLKINCVAGTRARQLCTNVATVNAIVNGLEQMPVNGGHFSRDNIIVWERWDEEMAGAGFKLNDSGPGARIVGISKTMKDQTPRYGYDGNASWLSVSDTAYFTALLSKVCEYHINVPVLKALAQGVTFSMKNMFGTFSTAYPHWAQIGPVYHKERETRIFDVNANPLIRQKFVLQVGDALVCMKAAGPAGPADFEYGAVLFTKDFVACDAVGVKIVREQGSDSMPAPFMTKAAEKGLGIADVEKIKIEKV